MPIQWAVTLVSALGFKLKKLPTNLLLMPRPCNSSPDAGRSHLANPQHNLQRDSQLAAIPCIFIDFKF